jgi:hypothetical protein
MLEVPKSERNNAGADRTWGEVAGTTRPSDGFPADTETRVQNPTPTVALSPESRAAAVEVGSPHLPSHKRTPKFGVPQRQVELALDEPMTVGCSGCNWRWTGVAREAISQSRLHRERRECSDMYVVAPPSRREQARQQARAHTRSVRALREILRLRDEGMKYTAIAEHLNAIDIRSARGKRWTADSVKQFTYFKQRQVASLDREEAAA